MRLEDSFPSLADFSPLFDAVPHANEVGTEDPERERIVQQNVTSCRMERPPFPYVGVFNVGDYPESIRIRAEARKSRKRRQKTHPSDGNLKGRPTAGKAACDEIPISDAVEVGERTKGECKVEGGHQRSVREVHDLDGHDFEAVVEAQKVEMGTANDTEEVDIGGTKRQTGQSDSVDAVEEREWYEDCFYFDTSYEHQDSSQAHLSWWDGIRQRRSARADDEGVAAGDKEWVTYDYQDFDFFDFSLQAPVRKLPSSHAFATVVMRCRLCSLGTSGGTGGTVL